MDFLDAKKQLRHHIMLYVGYILIAIAIVIATLVLLYQAQGFGVAKNGTVIQNGLLFFSSQPHPAQIYVNGKLRDERTNTRLSLPEGAYKVQLKRDDYRDWQRVVPLEGGSVEHFDYPFLFPQKLTSKPIKNYPAPPALATQSPDRRWLMVSQPDSQTDFTLYDLKNPDKVATTIALPTGRVSKAESGDQSWQVGEWADDNQHVVLQHNYDGKTEFILLDRTDPAQSLNLNQTLSANPGKLTLRDKKYDQYYLYTAASQELQTANLKAPTPVAVLSHVAAYRSYGSGILLYATQSGAPAGQALVKLVVSDQTYQVRTLPTSSDYLLDLTKYDGTFYVAVGATTGDKVYIYKDLASQLRGLPKRTASPIEILHVAQPSYLSFSSNAQYIVTENGPHFGVYDIENDLNYTYDRSAPLDTPQTHASWMDGNRLSYVSSGQLQVFDYDNTNPQTLLAASPVYTPFFAPNYKFVNLLAPGTTAGQLDLTQTPLLTPADQ